MKMEMTNLIKKSISAILFAIAVFVSASASAQQLTDSGYRMVHTSSLTVLSRTPAIVPLDASKATERCRIVTRYLDDVLHKRLILSHHSIYVINADGYIGQSTRSEIEYAKANGKEVIYLESE